MTDSTRNQLDALKALDAMKSSAPTPAPAPAAEKPKQKEAQESKEAPQRKESRKKSPKKEKKENGTFTGLNARHIGGIVSRTLRGDVLDSHMVRKQVKLIMLIAFYMIAMVYMRYQVEGLQKDKLATLKRIEYLNEHKIEIRKQYQKAVMISTISEALADKGISTISGPPYEL